MSLKDLSRICRRLCAITPKQKKNVYTDLTETIIKQTQTLTDNLFLIDKAHTIQITFNDLNSTFRIVHMFISHTAPIDDSSLPDIQIAIDNYMTTYTRMFLNQVIPKQHLLEQHGIPYIRKQVWTGPNWRAGIKKQPTVDSTFRKTSATQVYKLT